MIELEHTFEGGLTRDDWTVVGSPAANSTIVHRGVGSMLVTPSGAQEGVTSDAIGLHGANDTFFRWHFYGSANPGTAFHMFGLPNGSGAQALNLRIKNDGNLAIVNSTTVIATGTTPVSAAAWHCIEVRIRPNSGAGNGEMAVRLDGVDLISTSVLTHSITADYPVTIGTYATGSSTGSFYFDDIAIAYDDWIGPAPAQAPTTSILDDFNRANGVIGSNWIANDYLSGPFAVNGNQAKPNVAYSGNFWHEEFPSAQEVYFTVAVEGTSSQQIEIWFRMAEADSQNADLFAGYVFYHDGENMQLYKMDPGQDFTAIGSPIPMNLINGDRLWVHAPDETCTLFAAHAATPTVWEGVALFDVSDYVQSGFIGLDGGNTTYRFDDFGGGEIILAEPPATPTGLEAVEGDGQVVLSWDASSGATSYILSRSEIPGVYSTVYSGADLTYTDTDVDNGTEYAYNVYASNAEGDSAPSSDVSATPHEVAAGYNGFNSAAGIFPDADWRPFSEDSPWNLGDVADRDVHPHSDDYVETFMHLADMSDSYDAGSSTTSPYDIGRVVMNWAGHDVFHPIYWATDDDPEYTTDRTSGSDDADGLTIRMPQGAQPGDGVDKHLTVIQPDGSAIDFWTATVNHSTHVISYAIGKLWDVTEDGTGGGGTAAGFPAIAGQVTAAELEAGEINHALFIVCWVGANPDDTTFGNGVVAGEEDEDGSSVYPAISGDSYKDQGTPYTDGYTFPPMGCWIRLNMTDSEIDALSIPAWRKMICKALAKYGGFFGDTGGAGFGVWQFESAQMYTSMGLDDPFLQYAIDHPSDVTNSSGVRIFDPNSGVDWANKLEVVLPPNVTTPTEPGIPTGLTVTPGDGQILVEWDEMENADTYRVGRVADEVTIPYTGADTSFLDTNVENGTEYTYDVASLTDEGYFSGFCDPVSATPSAEPQAPAIPTNFSAVAGNAQVVLTWDAMGGAIDYDVWKDGEFLETVEDPTYTDTDVTNGTAYAYKVTANNAVGASDFSPIRTVTPHESSDLPIYVGSNQLDKMYFNGDEVDAMFLGTTAVYP